MTCFRRALSRKIDIKEGAKVRKVTAREAIAMTITNRALKGDPKLLPLIIGLDREISAAQEREKLMTIRENTTPKQAMEAYRRMLHGDEAAWRSR
jgi:hypothetical protein